MPIIVFDEKLSVNIKTIDDQHCRLIDLINVLYDAMKEAKGRTVLKQILIELADYTQYHFSAEEAFMKQAGYPKLADHIRQHADFTAQIREYQADCEKGKLALSLNVMNFLKSWLKNHILNTDKAYSECLIKNGLR